MDRSTQGVRGRGVATVGLGAAMLLTAAMTYAAFDARSGREPRPQAAPADQLVEAWATSRTATYRATGTFERTAPDGRRIAAEVALVQRPPDRLLVQFGEMSGRRGDRALRCQAPVGDRSLGCGLDPPGATFDEAVADEIEAFRSLVTGDDPLYEVRRAGDGCWRMIRTRDDPRGGFGLEAEICVDAAIGAVRSIDIDHGEIDERTVYDDITAEVTDADLEP